MQISFVSSHIIHFSHFNSFKWQMDGQRFCSASVVQKKVQHRRNSIQQTVRNPGRFWLHRLMIIMIELISFNTPDLALSVKKLFNILECRWSEAACDSLAHDDPLHQTYISKPSLLCRDSDLHCLLSSSPEGCLHTCIVSCWSSLYNFFRFLIVHSSYSVIYYRRQNLDIFHVWELFCCSSWFFCHRRFIMAQMIANGLVKEMLRPGIGMPVRQGDTVTVECTG